MHERTIVSSTSANVQKGLAAIGVGADDFAIGREGISIIRDQSTHPGRKLGTVAVKVEPLHLAVNCRSAKAMNIGVTADLLRAADIAYYCKGY
jgi:hypothetical protein